MSKYPVDVEVKPKSIQQSLFRVSANSTEGKKFRYSSVSISEIEKTETIFRSQWGVLYAQSVSRWEHKW